MLSLQPSLNYNHTGIGSFNTFKPVSIFRRSQRFIWVDICSDGPESPQISGFSSKEDLKFSSTKCQSKFHNTGKFIPFDFEGATDVVKNAKKKKGQPAFLLRQKKF